MFPLLIALATVGWGYVLVRGLDASMHRASDSDLFVCAFLGVFLLAFIGLLANFFIPLGMNPGPLFLSVGLSVCVFALLRHKHFRVQAVIVVGALFILGFRKVGFSFDAGLYHIPFMNWIAHYELPSGLANVEGRLGFNSTWLIFVSLFRWDELLGWRHAIDCELALRALVLGYVVHRLFAATRNNWGFPGYFYLSSLFVLLLYLSKMGHSGTDHPSNLFALVAWIVFVDVFVRHKDKRLFESEAHSLTGGIIVTSLCVLAVTSKISLLPVALLPMVLWYVVHADAARQVYRPFLIVAFLSTAFLLSWVIRNFLSTGCLIYPAAVTCFDVPWGVSSDAAQKMSSTITGWARAPGPGWTAYMELWSFGWIANWTSRFVASVEFQTTALCFGLLLGSHLFLRKRTERLVAREAIVACLLVTAVVVGAGLLLWFMKAPDPRFAWAFFAIPCVVFIYSAISRASFNIPTLRFRGLGRLGYSLVLGVFLAGILAVEGSKRVIPSPGHVDHFSGNRWKIAKPAVGDQCWGLFPCAPYPIENVVVSQKNGRLVFENLDR